MSKPTRWCIVCDWRPVVLNRRCRTCDMYRRRNGKDRPEQLVVAHGQRVLERMR